MSHIPRHRLSNRERVLLVGATLLLLPVLIHPALMYGLVLYVLIPLGLCWGAYRLIRAMVAGKPETPVHTRRMRTSSRPREWRPLIRQLRRLLVPERVRRDNQSDISAVLSSD